MQTTEATAPILPVISQVEFDRLAALQIKLEIIAILAALKNGKTCRRFLAKILKGATHNDCEFIPIILWHMFGATADGAPAMHPECLYPGNHREMSMNRLQVLLDAQYQISPSYDQLRRVFVALKKHGLLSNHLYRTQDANGKWTTESGYTFNTERWQALLKETAKAPKFKKGKKGKKATETKTGVRKKSSRVRSSETSEKPSIFSAAPCGASGTISSDNRERPDSSPGSSSVVSVSSSTVQQGELSATQQKTPATPSVEVCDFLSQKDQSARIKAKQEKDGPRYVENPNAPDFEVFLAEVLEHRATAGEGVPENWREALYTTEGSEDGLTLKPRIPDCTVLTPDDQSTTCGIWVHDGAFIRCSPADIELSKTVASHLGCPLRAQDWPRFLRQTHRPASDPLRLTAESFQEVVSALPGTGSDLNVNIEGKEYSHATLAPAIYEKTLSATVRDAFAERIAYLKLEHVLPFLYCDTAPARALLSPGNIGKFLYHWEALRTALNECKDKHTVRSQFPSISLEPCERPELETVADLERSLFLANAAANKVALTCAGADLSYDLAPLTHIQHAPQGFNSLSPEARQHTRHLMTKLFVQTPHIWFDLERLMGTDTFVAAMPVRDIDACRAKAHSRVVAMVEDIHQRRENF